jgi:hypothetical protein
MARLSFDEWAHLARRDRDAFERARRASIDAFLATRPAHRRERLKRLQWRIDRERERCANPLAACIHLSNLMWERFAGPDGLAAAWRELGHRTLAAQQPTRQVLTFRRRR